MYGRDPEDYQPENFDPEAPLMGDGFREFDFDQDIDPGDECDPYADYYDDEFLDDGNWE